MRLKYMYYTIKKNRVFIEKAKGVEKIDVSSKIRYFHILEYDNLKKICAELSTVACLKQSMKKLTDLLKTREPIGGGNSLKLSLNDYNEYLNYYNEIVNKLNGVIEFCESAGFDKDKQGFDIKLPRTNDFTEFAEYINILSNVFNQCPYLNVGDEKLEINSTDRGSIWLEFFVITTGSCILLSNLAKIIDKCVKIKSHITTCRQQQELYRSMKNGNDLLEKMINIEKQALDSLINQYVDELKEEIREITPEEELRVKYSLENITMMMDKGLEVYASINTAVEIKDLFPNSDDVLSLPQPKELLDYKPE